MQQLQVRRRRVAKTILGKKVEIPRIQGDKAGSAAGRMSEIYFTKNLRGLSLNEKRSRKAHVSKRKETPHKWRITPPKLSSLNRKLICVAHSQLNSTKFIADFMAPFFVQEPLCVVETISAPNQGHKNGPKLKLNLRRAMTKKGSKNLSDGIRQVSV